MITSFCYSQVPSYYGDIDLTLSGQALKDALTTKVTNTHTTFLSYTPGVWDALKQTDLVPGSSSKVMLIYGYNDNDGSSTTDRTRGVNNNGGGSTDWNREHVYPKSLGSPNLGTSGPGADAHSLRPADVQRNSSRGSRKFADGSGNSGTTSQGHWYPGDEWKGDVARMMMYMYVRYGNRCLPTNVGVGNSVTSDANMLQLFLEWNAEDPVSDLELQRNPILENLQGNRNPFIDNPAFATSIWGGPQAEDRFGNTGGGDTETPSIPANLIASATTETTTQLSWSASSDNIGVTGYDIYQNGTLLTTVSTNNHNVSGLTPGTSYTFAVRAKDAAGNLSAMSNSINVITSDSNTGGNATELFLSEYIEGSSLNKALEIANFTGGSVNLSGYTIKKQTNGSGSWSSGLNLSGIVSDKDVYVVANSSAATTIKNAADITSGGSELSFNGNDAIGLFKNGTLIDIIGTFNGGSSNFAKDVTLIRKSSVTTPSVTYNVSEWNSLGQDTFDNLGSHTFNGSGAGPDTQAPSQPTNLVMTGVTQNALHLQWNASSDNIGVTSYRILQDGNLLGTTAGTLYAVSGLSANTTYNFEIVAYDAANNASTGATINVTTLANTLTYCSSKGTNVNYEYIDYVGVGGIDNATGANSGYGDFTSQTGTVSYGTNTIILSAGFTSSSYAEKWSVWIDYNQNGTFEASEQAVTGSTSSSSNLSYTFTVPTSALSGNTRMRVAMKWNETPTACETFTYGEVEDYTVQIGTSAKMISNSVHINEKFQKQRSEFNVEIYPNPAITSLSIRLNNMKNAQYTFIDNLGRVVKTGKVTETVINLEELHSGLYTIIVQNAKGAKISMNRLIVK